MNYTHKFLVKPGKSVNLQKIDPDFQGEDLSKSDIKNAIEQNSKRLNNLQELVYAEHKRSLLICLQAIDAGGKDGTISTVFGAMNPQGCRVISFKQPSSIERDHDFLWRAHRDAPAKGEVCIFNRSHYEDVLVTRVKKLVPETVWQARYEQINAFEKLLTDNDTHILKFFLHISKDEQLKRFKDRLDDPAKNWKISASDYTERAKWNEYQAAFESAISNCSTQNAPWFIIPAKLLLGICFWREASETAIGRTGGRGKGG